MEWRQIRLLAAPVLLSACVLGSSSSPNPPDAPARDARTVVDPEELVALAGAADAADRLALGATARGYRLERRDPLRGLDLTLLTFRLRPGTRPPDAVRELEALEPGSTVGINHAYRDEPEETAAGPRAYADALIEWPDGGCPAYAPIGVLDTGLDAADSALRGARIVTRNFNGTAAGADGHGTAIAELLAGPGRLREPLIYFATVVGNLPGAEPAAGVDDIMRAIDWLQESGVRLVNVSLAGPYNKILDRGLKAAADRGMVIVAAVGNDGPGAAPRYPAAFDFVIAVTAVDAELDAYARAPRGGYIDFAAPGVDVYVPLDHGRYISGTSIAAPFVTALIASSPEAAALGPVASVRASLARQTVDLGAAGQDDTFGAGLARAPDACRAS